MVDIVHLRPWRDHQQRQARAGTATSLRMRGPGGDSGKRSASVAAFPRTIQSIGRRGRAVERPDHAVVIPPIRIIVSNDDERVLPLLLLLDEVHRLDDKLLDRK